MLSDLFKLLCSTGKSQPYGYVAQFCEFCVSSETSFESRPLRPNYSLVTALILSLQDHRRLSCGACQSFGYAVVPQLHCVLANTGRHAVGRPPTRLGIEPRQGANRGPRAFVNHEICNCAARGSLALPNFSQPPHGGLGCPRLGFGNSIQFLDDTL